MAANFMIDTHNHYWRYGTSDLYWMTPDLAPLQRTFTPDDIKPLFDAIGVSYSVIVQAARSRADTEWYLDLAATYEHVAAVIGWVDLEDPDVGDTLDSYMDSSYFQGIRATAENEPDSDWLSRSEVLRGIERISERGLRLELLVNVPHLRHVPSIAERYPEMHMVVDHLAKPPIASSTLDEWYRGMEALAPYPNIWFKISGLLTEADESPTAEKIRPVVSFAKEAYGTDRLMWGSDWPVCTLAADYETTFRTVREVLEPLADEERDAIYRANASRFYRVKYMNSE